MKKLLTLMFVLLVGVGMVYSQSITVTSPNGGENWDLGSTHNVTWTSSGVTGNVGIKLFHNGSSLGYVAQNIPVGSGSYSWTISTVIGVGAISAGSNYQIQVKQDGVAGDKSDGNFVIGSGSTPAASITVNSPNGGESWEIGSAHNVTWSSSGVTGNVGIKLFQNGSSLGYVAQNIPVGSGSYSWTISNIIGGGAIAAGSNYQIQVKQSGVAGDLSNGNFTISSTGGSGGIDPGILERLKDILRGMKEIWWWRHPHPPGPWPPGPCLSCPPEFDLAKLKELLAKAGLKEQLGVELFKGGAKFADLGKFGPPAKTPMMKGKVVRMQKMQSMRLSKMIILQNRLVLKNLAPVKSKALEGGKGFKLVFRNASGKLLFESPVFMKQKMMKQMKEIKQIR